MFWHGRTRADRVFHVGARYDEARQDRARRGEARQVKGRQVKGTQSFRGSARRDDVGYDEAGKGRCLARTGKSREHRVFRSVNGKTGRERAGRGGAGLGKGTQSFSGRRLARRCVARLGMTRYDATGRGMTEQGEMRIDKSREHTNAATCAAGLSGAPDINGANWRTEQC